MMAEEEEFFTTKDAKEEGIWRKHEIRTRSGRI
jgi:hypothetical protein